MSTNLINPPNTNLLVDLFGNADANTAALAALGKDWSLPPNVNVVVNRPTVTQAMLDIERWRIPASSTVKVQLPAAHISSPTLVFSHPYGDRIVYAGAANLIMTTGMTFLTETGASNNWLVTIDFGSTNAAKVAQASVGDYLLIANTIGTGYHYTQRGVYPITAISGNQITYRNTGWYTTAPAFTITSGTFVLLRTVFQFDSVDGAVARYGNVQLQDLVLEGNSDTYWDRTNVTGTEKGTQGIVVGEITNYSNNPSSLLKQNGNIYGNSATSVSLLPYVGIFGFDQQGIVTGGSAQLFGNYSASSNNKRRGYYADASSHMFIKGSSAGGNYRDGYIADDASNIIASSNSASVGNGGLDGSSVPQGYGLFSQSNSFLDFGTGIICANGSGGANAQNGSSIQTSNATYAAAGVTGTNGVTAQYGGTFVGDGSSFDGYATGILAQYGARMRFLTAPTVTNCTTAGIRSEYGSVINVVGATTFSGNTADYFNRNGSQLLLNGVWVPMSWQSAANGGFDSARLVRSGTSYYADVSLTSVGDLAFAIQGTGLLTLKASTGVVIPSLGTATLGRSANPWNVTYTNKVTLGADGSAAFATTANSPEGITANGPGSLIGTTDGRLFVKAAGTGNTGYLTPMASNVMVRVSLTSAYTVPANTNLVRFVQTATVASSTVTLPTAVIDTQPILFENYANAVTQLSFSPAVQGWTQNSQMNANSSILIRWDATDATWHACK